MACYSDALPGSYQPVYHALSASLRDRVEFGQHVNIVPVSHSRNGHSYRYRRNAAADDNSTTTSSTSSPSTSISPTTPPSSTTTSSTAALTSSTPVPGGSSSTPIPTSPTAPVNYTEEQVRGVIVSAIVKVLSVGLSVVANRSKLSSKYHPFSLL